ncbi:MAG: TnsA endonuclease N-terminal domain-containing protein [Nostochopsis sp.]
MLNTQEFNEWCRRLNLPYVARNVISQIRSTEPVRQVKSNSGNVSGNYCSQKMEKTLQFESHKVELPGIEEYEYSEDVLEFYDQPYRLTLKFLTKKGKLITVTHVPDFFVIRQQTAGFEEWKPQSKLEKLSLLQPNRYIKNQDGQWTCPPAEEQSQLLGCYYRIRSDAEIDWIKYRNRQFLKSYTEQKYQIRSEIVTFIKSLVLSQPGITYFKLLQYQNISPDDINALLVAEELYIDLSAAPAAKARFGSVIERIFGTTNTEFFYNLKGNTQITKNVRVVTKSNNPKGQAVWTLDELYEYFCAYSYEFYDSKEHPALLQTPRQAFLAGLAVSGSRPHKKIVYDQNFKIFTLPSTPKGTAKVQPSRGVKINYLYYWAVDDSFINPEVEGTNVPVRYDPFDMGTAYAYVQGQWVRCISDYYKSFHNCSEREVKLASLELHRSRQKISQVITISAKEKAAYLESAEAKEVLLLQRLHDLARLDVHSLIEGERVGQDYPQNIKLTQENSLPDANLNAPKDESVILEQLENIEPYKNEELWR